MEWDTAAGQAICEAVGISVIDQQTQSHCAITRKTFESSFFGNTTVMARYQHESHIRSILKVFLGESWPPPIPYWWSYLLRVWQGHWFGKCFENRSCRIFIKTVCLLPSRTDLAVCWETPQTSVRQTLYKSLSGGGSHFDHLCHFRDCAGKLWRNCAFIALTELFTKFALYYFHERLWLRLPLGRIRNFVKRLISKWCRKISFHIPSCWKVRPRKTQWASRPLVFGLQGYQARKIDSCQCSRKHLVAHHMHTYTLDGDTIRKGLNKT